MSVTDKDIAFMTFAEEGLAGPSRADNIAPAFGSYSEHLFDFGNGEHSVATEKMVHPVSTGIPVETKSEDQLLDVLLRFERKLDRMKSTMDLRMDGLNMRMDIMESNQKKTGAGKEIR